MEAGVDAVARPMGEAEHLHHSGSANPWNKITPHSISRSTNYSILDPKEWSKSNAYTQHKLHTYTLQQSNYMEMEARSQQQIEQRYTIPYCIN